MTNLTEGKALADSLVRVHGLHAALDLATRYAAEAEANGDFAAQEKWIATAAWIAEVAKAAS